MEERQKGTGWRMDDEECARDVVMRLIRPGCLLALPGELKVWMGGRADGTGMNQSLRILRRVRLALALWRSGALAGWLGSTGPGTKGGLRGGLQGSAVGGRDERTCALRTRRPQRPARLVTTRTVPSIACSLRAARMSARARRSPPSPERSTICPRSS